MLLVGDGAGESMMGHLRRDHLVGEDEGRECNKPPSKFA